MTAPPAFPGIGRRTWAKGLMFALLAPTGCTTRGAYTRVQQIWRTDAKVTLHRLLVIAVWEDADRRGMVENRVANAFTQRDVPAFAADPLVVEPYPYPGEALVAAGQQKQLDGALVVRLISYDQSAHVEVTGEPVGDDPRAKWSTALRHVYRSEGVTGAKAARVETLLYEAATERLVWSGFSETFAPADALEALESYGDAMTKTLLDGGLVAPS